MALTKSSSTQEINFFLCRGALFYLFFYIQDLKMLFIYKTRFESFFYFERALFLCIMYMLYKESFIVEDIVGKKILIHGYKHNGKIHRCWSKGLVLQETDDHYIVINNRTLVTESDGRMWHTREPAIWYMPKHKWYNVICMIRKTGVYYYCNIASPTLYDGEALKYIDYDLDLKVFPDGNYRILDQEEYRQHAREMGYSEELDEILKKQLDVLIELAVKKGGPFDQDFTKKWYSFYQDLKEGYYGKSHYNR